MIKTYNFTKNIVLIGTHYPYITHLVQFAIKSFRRQNDVRTFVFLPTVEITVILKILITVIINVLITVTIKVINVPLSRGLTVLYDQ